MAAKPTCVDAPVRLIRLIRLVRLVRLGHPRAQAAQLQGTPSGGKALAPVTDLRNRGNLNSSQPVAVDHDVPAALGELLVQEPGQQTDRAPRQVTRKVDADLVPGGRAIDGDAQRLTPGVQ